MKLVKCIFGFLFAACLFTGCKKKCDETGINNFYVKMYLLPNSSKIKLGDTLFLQIKMDYSSFEVESNRIIDIQKTDLNPLGSGLDFTILNRRPDSSIIISGLLDQFQIVNRKGGFKYYNNASVRINYYADNDAFVFDAYIIPKQKGLVQFRNYKAEGWMNGKCILNVFSPIVGSANNHHELLRELYGPGSNGFIRENSYYVWVE
jgi:hypothetical protein